MLANLLCLIADVQQHQAQGWLHGHDLGHEHQHGDFVLDTSLTSVEGAASCFISPRRAILTSTGAERIIRSAV